MVWLNRGQPQPEYGVGFADYQSSGGAMRQRILRGGTELIHFLSQEIRVHPDVLTSAVKGLHEEGNASIFNVALSDEQLARLGLN